MTMAQRVTFCFVFVMYSSCAKFEGQCSNISKYIPDSVVYCFSGTIYVVITFLICIMQKCQYLQNEKHIKRDAFFILYSVSNNLQLVFTRIGSLKGKKKKNTERVGRKRKGNKRSNFFSVSYKLPENIETYRARLFGAVSCPMLFDWL